MSRLFILTADLILCRSNEMRVTNPSSRANGILPARIATRFKLHSGSLVQFLKLPKIPSVHSDYVPEKSLKFSLELRGAAGWAITQCVCSDCKVRKGQVMWDMVDFTVQSTIVTIGNGTASTEFFIKCYAQHHGLDHHAFRYSPCFCLWLALYMSGWRRCHFSE